MAEKQRQVPEYFSADQLNEIKAVITKAEKRTSGEIRVRIAMDCDPDLKGKICEQAIRDFEKAGMHNTRDKIGVLILVVLNERRLCIIGDSGIHSKVNQIYWDHMVSSMSAYFKCGSYYVGICMVVENVGRQLAKHFPRQTGDVNELPDDVIVRGEN